MTKNRVPPGFYQIAAMMLLFASSAFAQAPTIFFTDLESGPKTGGENNKGIYVTLYGQNFGTAQGSSTVTVGGGAVDHCPVWGATWLWYQKITCQLGSAVSTGNIVVNVSGQSSNGFPFTVRSGNIYFADNVNGNDNNPGSVASPWKSVIHAKRTIADGDTVYLRAGTWSDTDDYSDGLNMSGFGGSSGSPRAFIGYPGEKATITCPDPGCNVMASRVAPAGWLVIAELDLASTAFKTHYIIDWDGGGGGDGIRWIGNKIHGSPAINVTLAGNMNGSYFLGNDDYDYWSLANGAGLSERGYGLYYEGYGTQQNILIDHNRFWNDQGTILAQGLVSINGNVVTRTSGDPFTSNMVNHWLWLNGNSSHQILSVTDANTATLSDLSATVTGITYMISGGASTKGLQIYGHCPHDCPGTNDYFKNVTISNNQTINNCMEGMLVGGTDGGTIPWHDSGILYIYNNLFVNNGACDNINGQTYSGLEIGDGYGGMNAKIWNNTFYLSAGGAISSGAQGDIYIFPTNESFEVSNNIFYAQPAGSVAYKNFIVLDSAGGTLTGTNNLFFSNSNSHAVAPNWVAGTVSTSDPKFVNPTTNPATADFRLQATSPAIDGGVAKALVTSDLQGNPRPQGTAYDVGAYEYGSGSSTAPPPPAAPTATLSASPASITQGQSSVLTYSCTNCTSIVVNGSPASALSGQVQVTPSGTTTYTVTAFGAGGSATANATVTVNSSNQAPPPPPPAPTATLSATPASIAQGQSAVLTYTCTNCASAKINGAATAALSGQMQVTPSATTMYTLAVSGAGGSASATATVTVASTPPPPPNTSDLSVGITHIGNFSQGQTGARYTITVTNSGSGPTSGAVTLTDTLPAGLTATAISGTGWTCTLSTLKCTRTTALVAGASYSLITVTVNVAGNAPASVVNAATVSGGGEQNTSNDTDIDLTLINVVQPDLTLTIIQDGDLAPGQTGVVFTLVVSNIGNLATSGTVTLTDNLSAGLTATAISGTGWACTLSTLKCTRSNALAAGLSYPGVNVTVNIASNAPSSVANTATVSGGNQQNTSNDTAADLADINSPAMIALDPGVIQFSASEGTGLMSQTVQMQNLGGGTLGWVETVQTDSGGGWLVAGPVSGVAPSTVAVTANPAGLAPGYYTGRIIMSALPGINAKNSPQTLKVQMVVGGMPPQINSGGLANGASFATDGASSPGAIAVLFGQGMATGTATANDLPLPMDLLGTEVFVNGIQAPLYFVSPSQINFQMPFEISGPTATIVVSVNGVQSPPVITALSDQAPGIFTADSSGKGQAAVLNEDGTPNSASNPAPAGSVIAIYLTGMGAVFPPLHSGQPGGIGADVNITPVAPAVLIGGSPVPSVDFSGAAPGLVGLDQINVRIPPGTPPDSAISLQIQVAKGSSNTATIAVQ